jgi:hypothetical protein
MIRRHVVAVDAQRAGKTAARPVPRATKLTAPPFAERTRSGIPRPDWSAIVPPAAWAPSNV